MWGIHKIGVDDRMTPRRGLILAYYDGKLEEISLILAVTGWRRHLQFMDYDNVLVRAKKYYWLRIALLRSFATHKLALRWHAGVTTDPAFVPSDTQFRIRRDPSV